MTAKGNIRKTEKKQTHKPLQLRKAKGYLTLLSKNSFPASNSPVAIVANGCAVRVTFNGASGGVKVGKQIVRGGAGVDGRGTVVGPGVAAGVLDGTRY